VLIDWQASKEEWITEFRARLVPCLMSDRRFASSGDLVDKFERSVERWRADSEIRQLINDANELAAAAALLNVLKPHDILRYEPGLSATRKTLDFLIQGQDGSRGWIDMKTVAPVWNNDDDA
jgi:hypothetical protein